MSPFIPLAASVALLAVAPGAAEPVKVGNGWSFTHYWPGDWTGDGQTDMLVRTSSGDMLLYPMVNGTFYGAPGSGKKVGNGWNFTHYWPGDWNGDGKLDMLVRTSSGDMLLVPWRNGSFY